MNEPACKYEKISPFFVVVYITLYLFLVSALLVTSGIAIEKSNTHKKIVSYALSKCLATYDTETGEVIFIDKDLEDLISK